MWSRAWSTLGVERKETQEDEEGDDKGIRVVASRQS